MSFKLYEISNQYLSVIDELANAGLTDEEIETSLCKQLEEIKENFENKSISVAKYIKNLEVESKAVQDAMEAMKTRVKRIDRQAEWLEKYLRENIEKSGLIDPIKCPEFEIKLVTNPPSVVIYDESLILDAYKRKKETISIDKEAIKKDLTEGYIVEGATIERKKRLVIK